MSTPVTLMAFRLKSFNCRTTVKILLHIKYVKHGNHLEIVRIAKGLAKKSEQTSRRIYLENRVNN